VQTERAELAGPGTILGTNTSNQITALFERSFVLGLLGADIPFVFIWDQDVVRCIVKGIRDQVAQAVLTAARHKRRLLVLSPTGRLTRWMVFLAPGLYESVTARSLRSELQR
jgi:hypothetical protein